MERERQRAGRRERENMDLLTDVVVTARTRSIFVDACKGGAAKGGGMHQADVSSRAPLYDAAAGQANVSALDKCTFSG